MTPFGKRMRELRKAKGVTAREMAADLGFSAAFLSALERGHRGRPNADLLRKLDEYFPSRDAAALRALAKTSHPRVRVMTAGLSADRTALANLISQNIAILSRRQLARIMKILQEPTAEA